MANGVPQAAHLGLNFGSARGGSGSGSQQTLSTQARTPSFRPEQTTNRHRANSADSIYDNRPSNGPTEQDLREEISRLREELAEARRAHHSNNGQAHDDDRRDEQGDQGRQAPEPENGGDEQRLFMEEDAAERERALRAFRERQREKEPKKVAIPDVVPGFKENTLGISKCRLYYRRPGSVHSEAGAPTGIIIGARLCDRH